MGKMFVHYSGSINDFKNYYSSLNSEEQATIDKKIVFINGVSKTAATSNEGDETEELSIVSAIYTHGEFYASAEDLSENLSDLKDKLDGLQGNFDEVIGDGLKYISSITVNGDVNTAISANAGSNLDLSIVNESAKYSEKNIIAATMGLLGFQLTVSDELNQAVIDSHTHANKPLLDSIDDIKVEKWDAAQPNVIETVKVNGVALNPDDDKAVDVVIPAATVTGVKDNDPILSLDGTELISTLSFAEEKDGNDNYIAIRGKVDDSNPNGVLIGRINTADFVMDGILENVELVENHLVFTFNADAGGEYRPVDSNATHKFDSVQNKFVETDVDATHAWFDNKQIKVDLSDYIDSCDAEGDDYVNASASGNVVSVSASNKTITAIGLAETALQEVTKEDSDYATVTVGDTTADHKQSIKVDVKVQAVASASAAKQGFADAYDVQTEVAGAKSYADDLFAWEEL